MSENNKDNNTSIESKPDVTDIKISKMPVGIKIGSQRTVIATEDGVNVMYTCIKERQNPLTGNTEYVIGNEAAELFGDEAIFMLVGGLPGDAREAELLKIFLTNVAKNYNVPENSYITYAIPSTQSEIGISLFKRTITQLPIGLGGKEVWNDSFLAALTLPDGMAMLNKSFVVVNAGSTTTEVIAVRKGEILLSMVTGEASGDIVDRWIKNRIRNETRGIVNIDLTTARMYKEKYANLKEKRDVKESVQVFEKGKYSFGIEECINKPIEELLEKLVNFVALEFLPMLAETNFSAYNQIIDKEFILTGGMAEIPGLKERFADMLSKALERDVTVTCPESPATASARGALFISKMRCGKYDI